MRRFLSGRVKQISNSVHHAKNTFDAAQSEEKKWDNIIKNADNEAGALIEEYKNEALLEKRKILEQTHNYAKLLKRTAATAVEQQNIKTIAELKKSTIGQAIELAVKRLSKEATDKGHLSLIDAAADKMSSNL